MGQNFYFMEFYNKIVVFQKANVHPTHIKNKIKPRYYTFLVRLRAFWTFFEKMLEKYINFPKKALF